MKTFQQLLSFAILTMFSSQASAHMIYFIECDESDEAVAQHDFESADFETNMDSIPGDRAGILGSSGGRNTAVVAEKCYSDSPEAKSLRALNPGAPESDRVAAMSFCKLGGYENAVDCAADVLNKGLVDASKACMNKLDSYINNPKINPFAHKIGGANSASGGVWHFDYRTSKEDGSHRHAYSEIQRDIAGETFAAAKIAWAKGRREIDSRTSSSTSTSNANAGLNASVTVGVPSGPNVTIGGEAGVAGGSEQGTSTQKGPMTQKELDTLWNKYYEVGKKDPQKAGFEPDILCMQNEKDCLTSSGQNFKNTSYKPDSPSKKEENGSNKSSSNSSSSTTPFSDNNSKTSSSSSASDDKTPGSITASHAGSWAGEPSKPSDGSVWADFGQEEPGNDPMAQCIFDAYKEKEKDSSNKTYDTSGSADNRSDVQKKRDAENLLKKGICDEKFFGREYCANWKQKRQMIDSPPGAFDGQTPLVPAGEQRERPGFLHFDPYQKETFKIPADLGPNILPGANGGTRELPRIK